MNVAIIPARGGSKRIPRKNIRPFHGKPIIAYSIEVAKASKLFSRIIVSTDDEEIAQTGQSYGAEFFVRTPDDGTRGTQELTGDVLRTMPEAVFACCIYPCAPMVMAEDLREAYTDVRKTPYNYVYAVGQFYFGMALRFITNPDDFSYSKRSVSMRFIDINTEDDWLRAEEMYADLHRVAA